MVAILILNWNGYNDTINCLKSLLEIDYKDFFVIVGDNGSSNNSLFMIENYLKESNVDYIKTGINEKCHSIAPNKVILCDLIENNGFSKGNNMILKYASFYTPDYYLLLNNDTEVKCNFLDHLINFHCQHSDYSILTPLIYYYDNKNRIWNAGGKLKMGFRKYFYSDSEGVIFSDGMFIECSFVTGCSLFITPDILNEKNEVFTERFFFGEEDFEFSMRQKRLGNKMACVCDSIIYHKVSASSKNHSSINKIFIHYLNRFIDMKLSFSKCYYILWKIIYIPYIFLLLKRSYSFRQCIQFISLLVSESKRLNGVDQSYFYRMMSSDIFS